MSRIEDVKAKIREGKLEDAMAMAMAEAMRIQIVTSSNQTGKEISCHSTIDLLENEIEHELGDKTLENRHFRELDQAHSRILQNVESLQQMFNLLQNNLSSLS